MPFSPNSLIQEIYTIHSGMRFTAYGLGCFNEGHNLPEKPGGRFEIISGGCCVLDLLARRLSEIVESLASSL